MTSPQDNQGRDAELLREIAKDESTLAITLAEQAVKAPAAWYDAVINKGMVFESRPPLLFDRDYFSYRCLRGTARHVAAGIPNLNGKDPSGGFATTRQQQVNGVAIEQPLIAAPAEFHHNIEALMRRPEFWAANDPKNTGLLLRSLGYSPEITRATASTDSGAWAGKTYWQQAWGFMAEVNPIFNDSLVGTLDIAQTDKAPIGAVDGPPAGGWVGENGSITLDEMANKVREMDAFCYAVAGDVSDKYLRNSWAEVLDYKGTWLRTAAEKAAIDMSLWFCRGTGVDDTAPAGILATIGSVARNKLQNIVKHDSLKAEDVLKAVYKLDAEVLTTGRTAIMVNKATASDLDTASETSRFIQSEGRDATGGSALFWLRKYPVYLWDDLEDLAATKFTGIVMGDFKRGILIRRGSQFSAVLDAPVMVGGQTKLQQRLASWTYTNIAQPQDNTNRGGAGPVAVVQPNRTTG